MQDFINLYKDFLNHLKEKSKFIANLQLSGKLEQYLVTEFIGFVHKETNGDILGFTNLGNKNERKIDIALVKRAQIDDTYLNQPKGDNNLEIVYAVESKYINNKHRIQEGSQAKDNIRTSIKSLKEQISETNNKMKSEKYPKHADLPIGQNLIRTGIYGLIFASFVSESGEKEDKEERMETFHNRIKGCFDDYGFLLVCANTNGNFFDIIYKEIIFSLKSTFNATLEIGLWKLDKMDI